MGFTINFYLIAKEMEKLKMPTTRGIVTIIIFRFSHSKNGTLLRKV